MWSAFTLQSRPLVGAALAGEQGSPGHVPKLGAADGFQVPWALPASSRNIRGMFMLQQRRPVGQREPCVQFYNLLKPR